MNRISYNEPTRQFVPSLHEVHVGAATKRLPYFWAVMQIQFTEVESNS